MSAIIAVSCSVRPCTASTTYNTRSAFFINCCALSTPICSTKLSVSRIPAVSTIFSGMPFRLIYSSITSRVVPGISVTMARSCPSSAFNKLDFPTFGLPAITTRRPSRIIFPFCALCNTVSICCCNAVTRCSCCSGVKRSISSSG